MPYDSIALANYLIGKARGSGDLLTPMKVQKLVYFAHGWNLAISGQPLLTERIEAWKYGPVVPELYRELRDYGSRTISDPITVLRIEGRRITLVVPRLDDYRGDVEPVKQLLDRIWVVYGKYTAIQLSNATHVPGSPWDITWRDAGGASHAVIDDNLIRQDFLKRGLKPRPQLSHA